MKQLKSVLNYSTVKYALCNVLYVVACIVQLFHLCFYLFVFLVFHLRTELYLMISPLGVTDSCVWKTLREVQARMKECIRIFFYIEFFYKSRTLAVKVAYTHPRFHNFFVHSDLYKWGPWYVWSLPRSWRIPQHTAYCGCVLSSRRLMLYTSSTSNWRSPRSGVFFPGPATMGCRILLVSAL